jgi:hypothetical protein
MSTIEYAVTAIQNNFKLVFTVGFGFIGILIAAFIRIRHSEIKTKREKFEKEYSTFKNAFTHATYQIKTGDTTLNLVILGEYSKQETAMTNFIPNLKGSRRKRFEKKWNEYATHYYQLKSIGFDPIAACYAILPIPDSPSDPESLDRYEKERRKTILNIYKDLLNIGNKRIWY